MDDQDRRSDANNEMIDCDCVTMEDNTDDAGDDNSPCGQVGGSTIDSDKAINNPICGCHFYDWSIQLVLYSASNMGVSYSNLCSK